MNATTKLKITGVALIVALYAGSTVTAMAEGDHMKGDGHDHAKSEGHMKGDGHDHGKMDADGHNHGGENAAAHAKHHPKPAHGGVVLELDEHHGELVVKDGKIALYLSNHDGKMEPAKGFSATAMVLTAQGRQGPVTLAAAGDNKLESTTPVTAGAGARVIITLKDPHGHMTQGRYQMP